MLILYVFLIFFAILGLFSFISAVIRTVLHKSSLYKTYLVITCDKCPDRVMENDIIFHKLQWYNRNDYDRVVFLDKSSYDDNLKDYCTFYDYVYCSDYIGLSKIL